MSLIVGRKDIRAQFESSWSSSHVPRLLLYSERTSNKAVKGISKKIVQSGMPS